MGAGIRCHRTLFTVVALAVLVALTTPVAIQAAETPRRGGTLLAVIGADPPSLDSHQESTFATLQLAAPLYSTLLQSDPYAYPKIIGDAATEWKISPDALTYTFKILWWSRNVVHWTKVKNYVAPPNHYANQKLQDVWLAED
jgi:ABC-type oligopeptide transport system substrate-binding subunit